MLLKMLTVWKKKLQRTKRNYLYFFKKKFQNVIIFPYKPSIQSLDFRFHPKNTNNYSPNTNLVDRNIRGDSILSAEENALCWICVPVKINSCSAFPPVLEEIWSELVFFSRAKTTCIRQERLCFNIGFILIHIIHIPLNITSNYCTY